MEKSDSFWQWGNARKKSAFEEVSCAADGSCSVANKIICVAGGFSSSKFPKEDLLKRRQFMEDGSHRVYDGIASNSGALWRDIGLPVKSSTMEVNLSNSNDLIEANSSKSKSPISVIQGLNVSSSDTSSSNSDVISCHPHGDLSTQIHCSVGNLVQDGLLCEQKKPSKLRVTRRGQKARPKQSCFFSDEGIYNSYTGYKRETSMEASSSCSISEAEAEEMQLHSWGMDENTRNLSAVGGSEPTSSYTDLSCKKPKISPSLISSSCFEALHMLADIAVRGLVPGCKEEDKAKVSSEQWVTKEIFHPTGVFFWQKRAIRRAKNAFISVQKMQGDEDKLMATGSETLLISYTNTIGNPGSMKANDNQSVDVGVADKGQVVVQTVRSSTRTRSQFPKTKYRDSVLQPLKKGIRDPGLY